MPARISRPAQDHTGESLYGPNAHESETPDGAMSAADYNRNHGRRPNAPTKGGPRQAAYDALLRPGKATD